MNTKLRGMIIELLDSPHGITDNAYKQLHEFAVENGAKDIVDKADEANGFWFLNEDDAETLRTAVNS